MKNHRLSWGLFKRLKLQQISSPLAILGNDTSSAALSTLLADQFGVSVIHIDGLDQNQLIINITNLLGDVIDITQLSGPSSSGNWNINLVFPISKFYFYQAPTLDSSSGTNWELATDSNDGWIQNIYLANTAQGTTIQPGETIQLVINYGSIVPDDPKVVNVQAVVQYQDMQTSGGTAVEGLTSPQNLDLMADAGRPSPLIGSFIGCASVLNDGTSQQDLTLQLVNTSQDPIQFIVPPSSDPTQSYIEVILPVSDSSSDAVGTLCSTSAFATIKASLQGSASAGWAVAADPSIIGAYQLTPDFNKVQNIPPQGVIELVLSGVSTSLVPGVVQVQVSLRKVAIYGTQTFGVALEKTPLIYNNDAGSGMTLSGGILGSNQALAINGDSSSELVHLNQSGTGHALLIDGGDVTINNSLNILSPNANTVNIGGSTSNIVTISASGGTNSLTQLSFKNAVNNWMMGTSENAQNNQFSLISSISNAASLSLDDAGEVTISSNLGVSNNISAGGGLTANTARIAGPGSATTDPSLSLGGNGNFNVDAPGVTGGRFTVQDTTGNVGINISNPAAQLHVNGNTILNGSLSANSGKVSLFGQPVMLAQGVNVPQATQQALTDGFLVIQINPCSSNTAMSFTYGCIYSAGTWFTVQGGTVGSFGPSWDKYMNFNQNSMCIPIQAGSVYAYLSASPSNNQEDSPAQVWWFPMGTTTSGETFKTLSDEETELLAIPAPPEIRSEAYQSEKSISSEFIELLDQALGNQLNPDRKEELKDLLMKLR